MNALGTWFLVLKRIFVQFYSNAQKMISCLNAKKTLRMKISHFPFLIMDETLPYKNSRRKTWADQFSEQSDQGYGLNQVVYIWWSGNISI